MCANDRSSKALTFQSVIDATTLDPLGTTPKALPSLALPLRFSASLRFPLPLPLTFSPFLSSSLQIELLHPLVVLMRWKLRL